MDANPARRRTLREATAHMDIPEISQLLGRGDFDLAVEHLEDLEALFASRAQLHALQARVLASMIYLPRMRLDDARRCWQEWLPHDSSFSRTEERLKAICVDDRALLGLALCEIANFLFRAFASRDGKTLIDLGLKHLEGAPGQNGLDATFVKHAKIHASVWRARLYWQEDLRREAFAELTSQLSRLADERRAADRRLSSRLLAEHDPGLDLAEGIVRDLLAELYSIEGHTAHALETVQQALVLMSRSRDRARLAHVYYLYAKLQALRSTDVDWTLRLFRRARALYSDSHPFRHRVSNQEVLLLVRNERVDEAHELLLEAEKALTADTMLAASERLYCSADFALTRCRILEWRARNGRGGWEDCLAHASRSREEVLAWRTLPPRFGAELHLHLGLANIRCSRIKAALKALESPATRRAPNVSTRVALSFARAEAYVRLKREDDGRRHWETGRHELAGVGSPFLEDWDRQLARALQRRVPLDKPFEEAEKEFQRMYIEFQLDRFLKENGPLPDKGALEAFAEYLGWSGSTLRRHLKKLRLKLDALDRLREP